MSTRLIEYDLLKKIIDKDIDAWLKWLDAVEVANADTVPYEEYSKLQNIVNESIASIIIDHIGVSIGYSIDDHWHNGIVDLLGRAQGNPDEYKDKIHDMVLNIYKESVDNKITKLEEMVTEYNCLLGSIPDEDGE
jgi:hypothetical protein